MTRRTRISVLAIALAIVAAGLLIVAAMPRDRRTPKTAAPASAVPPVPRAPARAGWVTVAGTVRDADAHPVAGVEVMFRTAAGDAIATTRTDGTYGIELRPGIYRVAARSDRVMSIALADRTRLPEQPSADVAGIPDESLMPRLDATRDLDGVDLDVVATWRIAGRVLDPEGQPVAGAVVRADRDRPRTPNAVIVPVPRPALGTDVAISDRDGRFELRVAPGAYVFAATHASYAGVRDVDQETVGGAIEHTIFLTAGCIITGRVVDASGQPAPDGAIEQRIGFTERDFLPAGRILADGTFRWVGTETREVTLRAWPWRSPPATLQSFACRDGARFDNVVFEVPASAPDLEGILVDADGAPVPFAFLDVTPLDLGGIGQQERTDAEGRWAIFQMPPGRYLIRAHAPGRGVVDDIVTSPSHGEKLVLGGIGRLEGTTTLLANGSFTLSHVTCQETAAGTARRSLEHRLVVVRGGRFTIDELPACTLIAHAVWRDQGVDFTVAIPAGGTATVEVALGVPRDKHVHGIVVDASGSSVAGAVITISTPGTADQLARTDDAGRFSLPARAGSIVTARAENRVARITIGLANVDDEQLELVLP